VPVPTISASQPNGNVASDPKKLSKSSSAASSQSSNAISFCIPQTTESSKLSIPIPFSEPVRLSVVHVIVNSSPSNKFNPFNVIVLGITETIPLVPVDSPS